MLRWLALSGGALACQPDERRDDAGPCPENLCEGSLTVRFSDGVAFDLYFVEGEADGEAFAFDCDRGEYTVREGFLELACDPRGFTFLRDAPAEVALSVNGGTYVGTLTPDYQDSLHPYPRCDHLCPTGEVVFDLGFF
jgi:hypothetical protein